ncbi:ABC transporter substrate-binding protein [Streptomonospora litoralis]|uniref:Leucine-, isoleucine-, valine-, threonine-, and alanine-binding protein n=1 Tax=Streptomonospora litoralis TaxID=2498135 RepID=A0A4V0ZJM2_9ACTN|nr:ABC transporter substrate-binding protein [Streptomonospora litoralis]QBI53972.1 Leucine-, isoleucine-, valine-, threonine-, and alanine-binding protein precursor [Streptomonospora litoralis]
MPSKKALSLTAAAAALTLGLTACGGGGAEGGGDGGGEPLQYGYVFPETGDLSHLGPPQISAAKYALSEINDAGGVMGTELPDILSGDEANDAAQANDAAKRLVDQDADIILGAAASGMTQAIMDTVTGAEVVQCSGSNTAPGLAAEDETGYYWRTAPSDTMQGPVLAQKIASDGHQSVAITYRADDYGEGLANATAEALKQNGIEVAYNQGYDPNTANFDSVVSDVAGADADAVVMVSFEEGVQIITGLIESGVGADQMYGTDGLNDETLAEKVDAQDPSTLAGFQGTAPANGQQEFLDGLKSFDQDLEVLQFSGQVYDCGIVTALAAEQAQSTDPTVFVEEMGAVSQEGTECSSFEECRDLIAEGEDIDYQGVSGPINFDQDGNVTSATFQIYGFNDQGEHSQQDEITVDSQA